jgi:membrane protein implicated in regulation of membrane protease activity
VDRRTLTVLVVAALAVVAIGLSAATLTSTVSPSGGNGQGISNEVGDSGVNQPDVGGEPGGENGSDWSSLIQRLFIVVGIIALLGALRYAVENPSRAVVLAAVLVVAVLAIYLVLEVADNTQIDPGEPREQQQEEEQQEGNGGGSPRADGESNGSQSLPLAPLFGFLVVVLFGIALVMRQFRPGSDDDVDEDGAESPEETAAMGAIAGRAADRIEDGPEDDGSDTDNEVYRAWEEMTTQLDIESGEATTPREFERRAVAAGMSPDDVRELTDLFETVRYGGETATADRERRAVSVLRRIESTYGGDS